MIEELFLMVYNNYIVRNIFLFGVTTIDKQELKQFGFAGLHNHTDMGSNLRFLDASETVYEVINYAHELGYNAISLTEHESLSSHMYAEDYFHQNQDRLGDMKLILGDEIYLVDQNKMQKAEEDNQRFRFNHFLLNALDKKGHVFLQKLSTQAWKNWHNYRGAERVPTFYTDVEKLMSEDDYKGHIIASTACLGGQFAQDILGFHSTKDQRYLEDADNFIQWLVNLFGEDNVKLEIMPSHHQEQLIVNDYIKRYCAEHGLKYIVTLDSHYLNPEQREIHTTLLKSRDPDRDVTAYDSAYMMSVEELFEYFDDDTLTEAFKNLQEIVDRVQDYTFEHTPIVPHSRIPEFNHVNLSDFGLDNTTQYVNIKAFVEDDEISNQYYMKLILDGFHKHNLPLNDQYLSRVDLEVGELIKISKTIEQPMSSYFLAMQDFVGLMWDKSIVGPGRGSSSAWLTNYLLGLTQIDAVKYDMPYYRFLSSERVSENKADQYPDIDVDSSGFRRQEVVEHIKDVYGHNKVLNMCTFSTIATRSAILTACRGLGIANEEADYIVSLLPSEGGKELDLMDALEGNEKKGLEPDKKMLAEMRSYPKLKLVAEGLYGLVIGRSQHASAVIVANDDFTNLNAMMKTSKGLDVTQFDAVYTERAGYIKFDFLSLDAIDRLQVAFDLLLDDKKIEWQGDLRSTYEKYFAPDKLNFDNQDMYQMLFNGDVINAFQFSSETGWKSLRRANARTFMDLVSVNGLMRLRSDGEEQPLDKYLRFRDNPGSWENEMVQAGLSEKERQTLHSLLDVYNGICLTQETLMKMSMDKDIAGFSLQQANKLRKAIAKKDPKKQEQQYEIIMKQGVENGVRPEFLNYVWTNCFMLQKGYAFSYPHALPYSTILITEMNICYRYGVLFWQTACLSVNAKTYGDSYENPNYAKVAKAIGELPPHVVLPPDINNSMLWFKPYKMGILYGLNAIAGIGRSELESIIKHRPFSSFDDFLQKTNGEITDRKVLALIKSGAFDSFEPDRVKLMQNYVVRIFPPKKKLTTVAIPKIYHAIPDQYRKQMNAYMLYDRTKKGSTDKKIVDATMKLIIPQVEEFEGGKSDDLWNWDGQTLTIDKKRVKKWLDKYIVDLKEWLKTPEACEIKANTERSEYWKNYCNGNVESWEFEALHMYTEKHELDVSGLHYKFNYQTFNELPEHPEIKGYSNWGGRQYPQYDHTIIAGTVLDKDNNKGIVNILTPNGVANVRVGRKRFGKYNKKIMEGSGKDRHCVDASWFEKGTKLLCVGYRRENDFILNKRQTDYTTELYKVVGFGSKIVAVSEKVA